MDTPVKHVSHRAMNGALKQSTKPTGFQRKNDFASVPQMLKKGKGEMRIQAAELEILTLLAVVWLFHIAMIPPFGSAMEKL